MLMPETKTLVIGLGNPILGDDGAGFYVAGEVARLIHKKSLGHGVIEVDTLALGGLALMERMIGFERAIVVDIIDSGTMPVGSVRAFPLEVLENPFSGHLGSAHETNLQTALEMGRSLGTELPAEVTVVSIESPYGYEFSEELSPAVAAAVPQAVHIIMDLLFCPG
jgi:hydrogenase maturation protease